MVQAQLKVAMVPMPAQRGVDEAIRKVVGRTGDAGLAVDAILMYPRPLWLLALINTTFMRIVNNKDG